MRRIGGRAALVGSACLLVVGVPAALAGSGVGAAFNLGVSNSVNATTVLTGSSSGVPQLKVVNTATAGPSVQGEAVGGWGVVGKASGGSGGGVFGTHLNGSGATPAVRGDTASRAANALGVIGQINPISPGVGSAAVRGINAGTTGNGYGVWGSQNGSGIGVYGTSVSGSGIFGTGAVGVEANVTGSGAVGVRSTTGPSANDAVQGNTSGGISDALQGVVTGSAAFAVFGIASGGGVAGVFSGGTGRAVSASNSSATNPTVTATNGTAGGMAGNFTGDIGVNVDVNDVAGIGLNSSLTGDTNGDGIANNDGNQAIFAVTDDTNSPNTIEASNGGVPSDAFTAEAFEAFGFVDINGSARVTGTLTKGAGSFEIDDPLDPANYYLRHSFVESPDMKNIYDGLVTTDGSGTATVQLPEWFGALNKDFRYQLTVVGPSFTQAIVSREIEEGGRSFTIMTEKPNTKVSWQVTGTRKDAYANAHRIVVRERKTGNEAGQYLHPELFGHPGASPLGLDLRPRPSAPNAAAATTAEADLQALIASKRAQALKEAARATAQEPPTSGPAHVLAPVN